MERVNLALSTASPYTWTAIQTLSIPGVNNELPINGNINGYNEVNVQNANSGANASSDLTATANNGNATTHYVDVGINGSGGGAAPFINANAAYAYSTDNELDIGALGATGVVNICAGASNAALASFDIINGIYFRDITNQTKQIKLSLGGMTDSKTLTIASAQTTTQTINIPNITASDTLATLGLAQTWTQQQTFPSGSAGAPSIALNDATKGWWDGGSGIASLSIAGVERQRFQFDRISINANSAAWYAAGITSLGQPGFAFYGADSTSCGFAVSTLANQTNITGRRAEGTAASPTALASSSVIVAINGQGYGATGFVGSTRAAVYLRADELWTDTQNGTRLEVALTAAGGNTMTTPLTIRATALTLADSVNLIVNATTGTKIATATTQKLGFWNANPIVQPAGATQAAPAAYVTGAFGLDSDAHMHALYDLVVAIRTALVNTGIIKGAA